MDRLMLLVDKAEAWVHEHPMVWPASLVLLAVATWFSALLIEPRPDQWVYLFDRQLGDTCAMITLTGQPCPSCGMTRSFAWAARFAFQQSFLYNPAGMVLFWGITAGGAVGAMRLVRRNPNLWSPSGNVVLAAVLVWTLGLYLLPWLLRVAGINPLP